MSLRLRRMAAPSIAIAGFVCAVGLALNHPMGAAADSLPPRPTRVPALPTARQAPGERVGVIVLQVHGWESQTHSVVQWQDPTGSWHDVEGWQQALGATDTVQWSVYPRDFGSGPFRWALFDGHTHVLIAASPSFLLPGDGGQIVHTISIAAPPLLSLP